MGRLYGSSRSDKIWTEADEDNFNAKAPATPSTADGFRPSWRKACPSAGVKGVTFHDLRGTAVTRLALAGCTEPQIASITGHTLGDVRSILNAYLHRDQAIADNAIRKLEKGTKSPENFPNEAECSPAQKDKTE